MLNARHAQKSMVLHSIYRPYYSFKYRLRIQFLVVPRENQGTLVLGVATDNSLRALPLLLGEGPFCKRN